MLPPTEKSSAMPSVKQAPETYLESVDSIEDRLTQRRRGP